MKRACTPPGQSRTCEWAAVELEERERERERKREKREAERLSADIIYCSLSVRQGRKSGWTSAPPPLYRMKCLLHSQPLFMPMPRFGHLANSVVARQARQTEAFRATPDAPSCFSLFVYLRLLVSPPFSLFLSPSFPSAPYSLLL